MTTSSKFHNRTFCSISWRKELLCQLDVAASLPGADIVCRQRSRDVASFTKNYASGTMSYTSGRKLYSCHGKNYMEVVDHEDARTLYFDNAIVQSKISLQTPHRLVLKYTQYMMAASLLLHPSPERILLIGIGAGSFLHFLHYYFPKSSIEGVDYSAEVIGIARHYFSLPENDNISIHCDDGLSFLSKHKAQKRYDLICIDAFNDQGMAKNIYSSEFFRLAQNTLNSDGIICCNLWSGNRDLLHQVKKSIGKNSISSLFIPVRKRENIIALLLQHSTPWHKICPSAEHLEKLSGFYHLDFQEVSTSARKNNMKLAERFQFLFPLIITWEDSIVGSTDGVQQCSGKRAIYDQKD